jgi:threonine dehydrogenase-like Zn-dependent dehydrogenase
LAALMAVQRGLDLHVMDRAEGGPKVDLARALGGTYHARTLPKDLDVDIVVECTGAPQLVIDVMCGAGGRNGIVCLTGVSTGGRTLPFDSGNFNRSMVLQNDVVFGSVNANRRHYQIGAAALAVADPAWLGGLLTRRVPLTEWHEAFQRREGDIKVVVEFESQGS